MNIKKINRILLFIILGFGLTISPVFGNAQSISNLNQPESQDDPVLNLVIIWHQHQPSYQDPETKIYEQPWVFMHGSNSYPYMADVLNDYPDINVTINLTPSMLQQLMDYVNDTAYDRRIEIAKMDEASMSDENKSVVLQYFFDINSQFRQNGTWYAHLSEKRNSFNTLQEAVEGFTDQDYLDLKALFFAHWINPRYTIEEDYEPPGSPLGYTKDVLYQDSLGVGGYSTNHKDGVLNLANATVKTVIQSHSDIQDEGRLEIITTPFYHPILPLLIDLNSSRDVNDGVADLPLPEQNTLWTDDALIQIEMGKNYTEDLFGLTPVGMWPSEEAVSEEIIPLVNQSGLEWFVTDYTVLENSLGVSNLTPEQWFKPYRVEKDGLSSAVFFRHQQLSDEIGFNYGGLDPVDAANSMKDLLHDIQTSWTGVDDPVFTVALDGENAWEHYSYNIDGEDGVEYTGNLFREYMYQKLEEAQDEGWLRTITPKQYLAEHPAETLDPLSLHTGSWSGDLNTWIGEPDENQAWDRLITARNDLIEFMANETLTKEALPEAWEAMYAAEGSDWFWWYGADRDSGHDELFDWQFKTIIRGMYKAINWTEEEIMGEYPYLYLKMLPPVSASIQGKYLPTIDGAETSSEEWELAANYNHADANSTTSFFQDLYLGVDEELDSLHIRIDTTDNYALNTLENHSIGLYFSNPGTEHALLFPRYADEANFDEILGFELASEIRIDLDDGSVSVFKVNTSDEWSLTSDSLISGVGDIVEISIPLSVLEIAKGDNILMRAIASNDSNSENLESSPQDGPWSINIPFGGVDMIEIFSMDDPANDEHGTYPTNPEMHPDYDVSQTGLMDILRFRVGYQGDKVYFEFKFRELFNPWNGPGGYSHPLMQVYIDQDQIAGSGATECDQNGHFNIENAHAWEYLVRADGWLQYIKQDDQTEISGVETFSDSVDKIIVFSAPISVIGTPTEDWFYTVVVGSQDFQAFREFYAEAQEWKFGGGDDGGYDPNIVDCLLPGAYDQEDVLTSYDNTLGTFTTIPAVGLDTEDPVVSITNNITSFTIERGEDLVNVTIEWDATDNGGISRIEVFNGTTLLAELTGDITNHTAEFAEGTYNISVFVYDGSDNSASDTILIEVVQKKGIPGYQGIYLGFAILVSLGVIVFLVKRNNR